MENTQILDANLNGSEPITDVESLVANRWKRFFNFIIDYVVVFLIFFIVGGILGATDNMEYLAMIENPLVDKLATVTVFALYTTIFEALFGKSIGKFITRTKVVKMDGTKPNFINLLGRNFARFIPFNAFSFFGNQPVGWHDTLSKTRVIND